jgi:hypothetical protein
MSLESTISKLSNDIYFIIYILYYADKIYDLKICASPINWGGGSTLIPPCQIANHNLHLDHCMFLARSRYLKILDPEYAI